MKHHHIWAKLLAEKDGKTIATSLFTCLKCGLLKIGERTIKISKHRLDMGDLPIKAIKTATFESETDNGNSGTEKTIDWANGQKQKITLTGNCAFTFSAPLGPCNLILRCFADGTVRTITWPGAVKWLDGTAPTMTGTSGKWDIVALYWDGVSTYSAVISQNFG